MSKTNGYVNSKRDPTFSVTASFFIKLSAGVHSSGSLACIMSQHLQIVPEPACPAGPGALARGTVLHPLPAIILFLLIFFVTPKVHHISVYIPLPPQLTDYFSCFLLAFGATVSDHS